MKKWLLILASGFCTWQLSAQEVSLQWKLQKGDTLHYKTYLNDLDTSANTFSVSFHNLMGLFIDSTDFKEDEINTFCKKILQEFSKMELASELTENTPGIVDIIATTGKKNISLMTLKTPLLNLPRRI